MRPVSFSSITLRLEVVLLVAIILIALFVRIPGLGDSLWSDEVWYTRTMFEQADLLRLVLWMDVHPPAYALTLMAWTGLFGDSEVTVRLPSFLFGLGSLLMLWYMARHWLGPHLALLSAALIALSPVHIWYSYENKTNMMLLLLTIMSVWLYWRASERGLKRNWIIATAVMIAALYTHAYAVPIAAAIFLWLGWRTLYDHALAKPLVICVVVIVFAVAPWVVHLLGHREELMRSYLRELSLAELYKLLLVWLPSGNALRAVNPYRPFSHLVAQPWPYFLIEAFVAVLLVRGLGFFAYRARGDGWFKPAINSGQKDSARLVLLWFCVPLIFTVVGSSVSDSFYLERNLLVILPPFLLILAAGAYINRRYWVRVALTMGLVTLFFMATLSLPYSNTEEWTVYKYKVDWRTAAYYFHDEIAHIGPLAVLLSTPTREFPYYQRRIMLAGKSNNWEEQSLVEKVCKANPEAILENISKKGLSSVYLVENKTWLGCWKRVWKSYSTNNQLQFVEQKDFKGLTIYKFNVQAPTNR